MSSNCVRSLLPRLTTVNSGCRSLSYKDFPARESGPSKPRSFTSALDDRPTLHAHERLAPIDSVKALATIPERRVVVQYLRDEPDALQSRTVVRSSPCAPCERGVVVRAFRSARKSRRCRCRIACGNWRSWAQGGKSPGATRD